MRHDISDVKSTKDVQIFIVDWTSLYILPPRPGGGLLGPKRYSADWFLNKFLLLLGLPCYQFFHYIVGFYSIVYFHLIYMDKKDLAFNNLQKVYLP